MEIFKRKIYQDLVHWKEHYRGTKALRLEGARRVGKTTIVEQFAKNEYESYIILDFSKTDPATRELISDHSDDLNRFFLHLQSRYSVRLHERKSLVVFDEVQLFPPARTMIKHLVADGRYDYIETGSLLTLKQNLDGAMNPSGERRLTMYPMDFEEFLWSQGDEFTIPLIRDAFENRKPLGFEMHKSIMGKYTTYMLVGGMPEAVSTLTDTWNFDDVEDAKREILDLYYDDLPKIKVDHGSKSKRIMDHLPTLLSKHEKSFSPTDLRKGSKTREYLDSVLWLEQSRMVNLCYRCTDPGPALDLSLDEHSFKIYMADTGLLVTAALRSNIGNRQKIYEDILSSKMNLNKGMFFENMVAQELVATRHRLFFCRFDYSEEHRSQEIDFIMADGSKIVPMEVKSGYSSKHISLDRFMEKYRIRDAVVIHSKDLREEGGVLYLPIYMTMFLGNTDDKPLPEPKHFRRPEQRTTRGCTEGGPAQI